MPAWLTDFDTDLLLTFNSKGIAFLDTLFITCTTTLTWLPFFLGAVIMLCRSRLSALQVLLVIGGALLGLLIADGVAEGIVKPWVQRLRPCNEPALNGIVHIVNNYRSTDYSFFSGHATNTSMLAMLLITLVRNRHFAFAAALWSLLNCYTRLYLAQHYPTDIIVGLLWGSTVGAIIGTRLHRYLRIHTTTSSAHHPASPYPLIPSTATLWPLAGLALSSIYAIIIAAIHT